MIVVQKKSGKLRRGYISLLACTLLLGDAWVVTPLRRIRICRVWMMGKCAGRSWINALLVVIWIVSSAILIRLRLLSVRHPCSERRSHPTRFLLFGSPSVCSAQITRLSGYGLYRGSIPSLVPRIHTLGTRLEPNKVHGFFF